MTRNWTEGTYSVSESRCSVSETTVLQNEKIYCYHSSRCYLPQSFSRTAKGRNKKLKTKAVGINLKLVQHRVMILLYSFLIWKWDYELRKKSSILNFIIMDIIMLSKQITDYWLLFCMTPGLKVSNPICVQSKNNASQELHPQCSVLFAFLVDQVVWSWGAGAAWNQHGIPRPSASCSVVPTQRNEIQSVSNSEPTWASVNMLLRLPLIFALHYITY